MEGLPGPCCTEFSDVSFDFIVVGTNKIYFLMNSIVRNLNYLAFATTGVWINILARKEAGNLKGHM